MADDSVVDKITPTDPRVKKDFKEVNGQKWCMSASLDE